MFADGRLGALPRSGQPIQPVDGGLVEVLCPVSNPVQKGSAGSLEAAFTTTVAMFGRLRATEIVEYGRFSCRMFVSGVLH